MVPRRILHRDSSTLSITFHASKNILAVEVKRVKSYFREMCGGQNEFVPILQLGSLKNDATTIMNFLRYPRTDLSIGQCIGKQKG